MEFKVQQKAEVWYETTIEANSAEEAIQKVAEGYTDGGWEALLDAVQFEDEFWTEETGIADSAGKPLHPNAEKEGDIK